MSSQRVREGESRAVLQPSKWTAEGTVKGCIFRFRVFCDVRDTSVSGDMLVSRRAHEQS